MKLLGEAGSKKCLQPLFLVATVGMLATGCQTYEQQNKVILHWQQGNLTNAVVEAKTMVEKNADNKNTVIWRLEQGAVLRAAGLYADSNDAFDQAQLKIDDYAQKAKVRVGQEAGALLSNQANLAYEGRSYDGIMLNTYKALNYLALGQPDKARPEIIRAYQRQQDAVEANKKRIEKIQAEVAENTNSVAIKKAQEDPKFKAQMQGTNYANLDTVKVYADYVNPFTVYLDGLYFMANAADASDLERAHKSLERVNSFAPDNDYVKQDLATIDGVLQGHPLPALTYVIFETGCAPARGQIRIDVPIIISKVSYVGAAFPTLKLKDNYSPRLTVTANGTNEVTALVSSIDGVVALDFKNEMPVVIAKTIASTVTKAVLAYVGSEAAKNAGGDWAQLAFNVANVVYQAAVNIADERTWTTLPKEFQVARVPTPADHKLELSTPNGMRTSVTIGDGLINVVYVKSITASTPLLVSQFKLGGSANSAMIVHTPNPTPNSEPVPPAAPAASAVDTGGATIAAPPQASQELPTVTAPETTTTTNLNTGSQAKLAETTTNDSLKPEVNPTASIVAVTTTATTTDPTNIAAIANAPGQTATVATGSAEILVPAQTNSSATGSETTPPAAQSNPAVALTVAPTQPAATVKPITNPEVVKLCAQLKSDRPAQVILALKILRRMDCPEAVPQILPCLNHYNVNVIRDACRTLAVIGDKSIIPSITPLLQNNRLDVRRDAQAAINRLQAKS